MFAIKNSKKKDAGRGVFTNWDVKAGNIVETAPIILLSPEDSEIISKTQLHNYTFQWGENKYTALALGNVSLYNHSYQPNCQYEMNFITNEDPLKRTISIRAVRDILAGEELFVNYNGNFDDQRPVWFSVN